MSPRMHLIFSCARPWNIPILATAYLDGMEPHPFEVRMHVALQGPERDPKGEGKQNEIVSYIPNDGWLMFLADDTDQHPSLFRRLGELIFENPNAGAFVFHQQRKGWPGNLLPCSPDSMKICQVCGGQVVWKREFLGDERFRKEDGGVADGRMIERKWAESPERFVFVSEVLMRFGSLEDDGISNPSKGLFRSDRGKFTTWE